MHAAVALVVAVVLLAAAQPVWAASSHGHVYSRRAAAGQAALSRMGPDGRAAAKFAAQSAPHVAPGFRGIAHTSGGGSALGGAAKALSGSGGMGFPMPVLLIAMLAGAVLFGAWRVRRGEGTG